MQLLPAWCAEYWETHCFASWYDRDVPYHTYVSIHACISSLTSHLLIESSHSETIDQWHSSSFSAMVSHHKQLYWTDGLPTLLDYLTSTLYDLMNMIILKEIWYISHHSFAFAFKNRRNFASCFVRGQMSDTVPINMMHAFYRERSWDIVNGLGKDRVVGSAENVIWKAKRFYTVLNVLNLYSACDSTLDHICMQHSKSLANNNSWHAPIWVPECRIYATVIRVSIGSDNGLSPIHYLNQCWDIVNWTFRNKLQWNINQNTKPVIHQNTLEYIIC